MNSLLIGIHHENSHGDTLEREDVVGRGLLQAKQKHMVKEGGVGIITKQNTTADVKPGETKRQAAKFGFKLDSKGRPPQLR